MMIMMNEEDVKYIQQTLEGMLNQHRRNRKSPFPIVFDKKSGPKMLSHVLNMPEDMLHENTDMLVNTVWDAQKNHCWLLFTGGYGKGKSAMMRVVHCCISAHCKAQGKSISVVWKRAVDLVESDDEAIRNAIACDLLIIDDIGVEPRTTKRFGVDTTPMDKILSARYDLSKPVYMTTNKSGVELRSHLTPRVFDRVIEMAGIVKFDDFFCKSMR